MPFGKQKTRHLVVSSCICQTGARCTNWMLINVGIHEHPLPGLGGLDHCRMLEWKIPSDISPEIFQVCTAS